MEGKPGRVNATFSNRERGKEKGSNSSGGVDAPSSRYGKNCTSEGRRSPLNVLSKEGRKSTFSETRIPRKSKGMPSRELTFFSKKRGKRLFRCLFGKTSGQ